MTSLSMQKRLSPTIIRRSPNQSESEESRLYVSHTYTTARLQLSRPALVFFQEVPAGSALPHPLLVAPDPHYLSGSSDLEKSGAPDAQLRALLGRAAPGACWVLGCATAPP